MRHFCSTTTKPEYESRGVLAHKGLQEQPEGVLKREERKGFACFLYGIRATALPVEPIRVMKKPA